MSTNKDLKKFDKSYLLTIIGVAFTIGSIIFAVFTFLYKAKPNLEISILSRINVLDINATVSSLDIILDSISLKKSNENIKIYNIRIANTGDANITTELFDNTTPLGIRIENGYLLERPELMASSNDYLKHRLSRDLNFASETFFTIPPIILDKKDFFDLKFLVVHHNDSIPTLHSSGKISGQKDILINENIENIDETPFWKKAFSGTLGVQAIRLFFYLLGWIIIILIIAWISSMINSFSTKRKRNRAIKLFKQELKIKKNEEFILDSYREHGYEKMYLYNKILNLPLKEIIDMYNTNYYRSSKSRHIKELIDLGIINIDKNTASIDKRLKSIIDKLYLYLEKNGYREEGHLDYKDFSFVEDRDLVNLVKIKPEE